jgi:hypothetical protein
VAVDDAGIGEAAAYRAGGDAVRTRPSGLHDYPHENQTDAHSKSFLLGTNRPSQYCFGMKIPQDLYKEFQRLEKAEKRDSKYFVQCTKCGEWLDSRNFKRESNSWPMYVALGVFGVMGTLVIWLLVD